jgi:hypothetical protein
VGNTTRYAAAAAPHTPLMPPLRDNKSRLIYDLIFSACILYIEKFIHPRSFRFHVLGNKKHLQASSLCYLSVLPFCATSPGSSLGDLSVQPLCTTSLCNLSGQSILLATSPSNLSEQPPRATSPSNFYEQPPQATSPSNLPEQPPRAPSLSNLFE